MQCDRVRELIGAYLDQELDAETRCDVAGHLGACRDCSTLADDVRRVSQHLAAVGREPAPGPLAANVRTLLAGGETEAAARPNLRGHGWLRQAAALLIACGVSAGVTALLLSRASDLVIVEREVAAAHMRSLLQDSLMQIASSDKHTIKPWFAGRLEFAPSVKDLTAEGFPLTGARLDYIGERRVAALVYHRRLHVVNVFLWPSADGTDSAPRELSHRGYNVVTWSKGGIAYWAISDLNMAELRHLQTLL